MSISIEQLYRELERVKAIQAVQNCMGHYETLHYCGDEVGRTGKDCFALWRDDVSVEVSMDGGVYGCNDVNEYWTRASKVVGAGNLVFMHTLATPIIEIAGNCMTAKAIWCSPGFETGVLPDNSFNAWCWGKYGVDFIKNPETGEWRMWHMKWFRSTRNDYDKSFTEFAAIEDERIKNPPQRKNKDMTTGLKTFPNVFHRPFSADIQRPTHPFPFTPSPYEDYIGDFRWIYGGEDREKRYGVKYDGHEKYYNKDYPARI